MTQQQGKQVDQKMGALYMECSSKEMSGVHEIFDTAIDIAVRGQDELAADAERAKNSKLSRSASTAGLAKMEVPPKKKTRSKCKIL